MFAQLRVAPYGSQVTGGGNAVACAEESKSCSVIIAGHDYWKHGVSDSERSAHIGIARP